MPLIALAFAALLQGQPVDCTDADHRALDFWVGEWSVSPTGGDTVIAQSSIQPVMGGCAIQETYHQTIGPGGVAASYSGGSYSVFDAASGRWRQFYVDSNGTVTDFHGDVADGALVLTTDGGAVIQRMTVAPQPDGTVRQSGESSRDGGASWTAGYDFTYRPRR